MNNADEVMSQKRNVSMAMCEAIAAGVPLWLLGCYYGYWGATVATGVRLCSCSLLQEVGLCTGCQLTVSLRAHQGHEAAHTLN